MNKKSLITKLICLIVLLVLVCAVAVQFIFGGSSIMSLSNNERSLVFSKTFDDVSELKVSSSSYAVEVVTHRGDGFTVDFYRNGLGTMDEPTVELKGGVLTVEEPIRIVRFQIGYGKIVISVPEDSVLPYNLKSTSGSVKLDAQSTSAKLKSVSGSVSVYQPGETLDASSTSGSVKVYAPFNEINAHSISGSVKVTADAKTQTIKATSTSGSVRISLDGVSGYTLDYKTVSGSTKDEYRDFSYGSGRGNTAWGDESLEMIASSTSGSIRLTDWND